MWIPEILLFTNYKDNVRHTSVGFEINECSLVKFLVRVR